MWTSSAVVNLCTPGRLGVHKNPVLFHQVYDDRTPVWRQYHKYLAKFSFKSIILCTVDLYFSKPERWGNPRMTFIWIQHFEHCIIRLIKVFHCWYRISGSKKYIELSESNDSMWTAEVEDANPQRRHISTRNTEWIVHKRIENSWFLIK